MLTLSFSTLPELARLFSLLGNEQRLAVLGAISADEKYAREIAEELGVSRPLAAIYLRQLEKLGLAEGTSRTSDEPPYLRRYYRAVPFELMLNLDVIMSLERSKDETG
ncbi:winged helix-turn-helix domain-containing protein [Methanoculleus sp.]|jgi:ArsR family transcriptional regulator|uniref:ArsR/SmtB family transcription factor n=1 Tax=Methanoculleus sp. TaxID=90427 RepID=UPI001BD6969B|nr:winged helix-turn-helix domain-containing protein [Methanoculleus sp.]